MKQKKFLLIQTAFIGDVILATGLVEKLHAFYPNAVIDFVVRKGNEGLLNKHPIINTVFIWDKTQHKKKNLFKLRKTIQKQQYDVVVNLQRFASTGMLTWLSGAREKIGFNKNPFSFSFTKKVTHQIGNGKHEIERNHQLINHLTDDEAAKPKLYPTASDQQLISSYTSSSFITLSPASVWFTKQLPKEKWIEIIDLTPPQTDIYLLGGETDKNYNHSILHKTNHPKVTNLAGKLTLLQSAALMAKAKMNYVNDSAPLHLASAMNAPLTAFFCSTLPSFGFGPLSTNATVIETHEELDCRPCGLHGKAQCPKGHFKCGTSISIPKKA